MDNIIRNLEEIELTEANLRQSMEHKANWKA